MSPGTSVFRDKPNAAADTPRPGGHSAKMTRSGPDSCLEKGKQGTTYCQRWEAWKPPTHSDFIPQALLFYTNALTENDAKLQQAACVALKHLRVSLTCPHRGQGEA